MSAKKSISIQVSQHLYSRILKSSLKKSLAENRQISLSAHITKLVEDSLKSESIKNNKIGEK